MLIRTIFSEARWRIAGVLLVLGVASWFLDAPVAAAAIEFRRAVMGGDLRRELEALQQFGGLTSLILTLIIVGTVVRRPRPWMLGLVCSAAATSVTVLALKVLFGRPRPKFDEPTLFLGPLGRYEIDAGVWAQPYEVWLSGVSDLWSMPSSHTSAAVVLAVALARLVPRLGWLWFGLAGVVAFSRVVFGAHYLSDVLVGAAVALLVAPGVMVSVERAVGARMPGEPKVDPGEEVTGGGSGE